MSMMSLPSTQKKGNTHIDFEITLDYRYSPPQEMLALTTHLVCAALLLLSLACTSNAFTPVRRKNAFRDPSRVELLRNKSFKPALTKRREDSWSFAQQISRSNGKRNGKTSLFMYNLPPGKNNNDNDLGGILKGAASLFLVVAFFVSPLGGLVLGIFNSFLVLAILVPILATVGVTTWQYFNTISGDCPNCGAPVRVKKAKQGQGEAQQPSICFTCGSIIQAKYDNSGIDNITGRNSLDDLSTSSPFGGGSVFDIFGGGAPSSAARTTTTTVVKETKKIEKDKIRREATIIDVEVDDDKPWQ
jgi:hypothetical protein